MINYYLIFKKDKSFLGFTTLEPTTASGIIYKYIKVDESIYRESITSFEQGLILELNDENTYFVTK